MIYWIENIKDGSCIAGATNIEDALYIQDKKLKEYNIDTYIRRDSIDEIEEKLVKEIKEKIKEQDFFKDLNKEILDHLDSIIKGIIELKKLQIKDFKYEINKI